MASIVTLDEYKTFASIAGDKTNSQLTSLLEYSTLIVQNYTGVTYAVYDEDITVNTVKDRVTYFLDIVGTITTCRYYTRSTGETTELYSPADFIQDDYSITIFGITPEDYDILYISMSAESIPEDEVLIPDDIKLAVMLLTQYYYKKEYNKTSSQSAGQQIDYRESKNIPNRVRALLDFHRII